MSSTEARRARATPAPDHFRHSYSKDRSQLIRRLSRMEGQVRGIARMIEQDRYCIDVLNQALAVRSALSQVELLILQDHADDCVEDAILASNPEEQRQKFRELVDVFEKVCR
jgi:DNA-binding FrmR family transcriptional regulator